MIRPPRVLTRTPEFLEVVIDALSDVLRVARLSGGAFLHAEFFEPWCMAARIAPDQCSAYLGPASHIILYHYVVTGNLRVRLEGEDPFELAAGEVVLFPRNDPHLLGSDFDLPPTRAAEVIRPPRGGDLTKIRLGGDGACARVICGFLGCENADGNPVIGALPAALKLQVGESGAAEWIRSTFQFAADEVARGRAGSDAVLAKLSELLFVEAVRRYAETLPPEQSGWLAGLADPYVSRALSQLHTRVDHDWTVEALGREIGLSRSALAERFTRVIGVAPMQYLANWRMQVAAQSLRGTSMALIDIAEQVGYESEAAFSRAFKKAFGEPPATWRRRRSYGQASPASAKAEGNAKAG